MGKRGQLITIEGIEGVGKTTVMDAVIQYLTDQRIDTVRTREPGGTKAAEQIREVLLHPSGEKLDGKTELLLIFACRAQHIKQVIAPALLQGQWVICDRFTDASYAYQGGGRGVPDNLIATIEQIVQDDLRPDQVILLDAPVDVASARVSARNTELDRIEQEKRAFFERVREKYLSRAMADPKRYTVVNAEQDISAVIADVLQVIKRRMAE